MTDSGLLALTVEFFRIEPVPCNDDGSGQPIYNASQFIYGRTTCGLTCSVERGPHSPMRRGSADNIYVVPEPQKLTFGAVTLLAAACCIPAVLSMISTWDKILKINWKERFGDRDADEVIEGTNGATIGKMKGVNSKIREFLSVVEVPLFAGAVLTIIIMGEINFWSHQVWYQTEPMANIGMSLRLPLCNATEGQLTLPIAGQWAPIVASGLAAIGSLYMLLAESVDAAEAGILPDKPGHHCACPTHGCGSSPRNSHSDAEQNPQLAATGQARAHMRTASSPEILAPSRSNSHSDHDGIHPHDPHHGLGILHPVDSRSSGAGMRPEVGRILSNIAHKFGTADPDRHDDHEFRHGKATGFPEIPGEGNRNRDLIRIKEQWGQSGADDDDDLTPRGRRSRANSFTSSVRGAAGVARSVSMSPRAPSPHPEVGVRPTGPALSVLPASHPRSSHETNLIIPTPPSSEMDRPKSHSTVVTLHSGHDSPSIVVSSEPESSDPSDSGRGRSPLPSETRPEA